jgi:large subunit ribosomal protein L22
MRRVADLVRGKTVDDALTLLSLLPKAAAVPVRKTVQSAAANALAAEGTAKLKTEDLKIDRIFVDGGPMMKRIRPMGMGRAYRIHKRLCHLTVILEGEHEEEAEGARPAGKRSGRVSAKRPVSAARGAAKKTPSKSPRPARKRASKTTTRQPSARKQGARRSTGGAARKKDT